MCDLKISNVRKRLTRKTNRNFKPIPIHHFLEMAFSAQFPFDEIFLKPKRGFVNYIPEMLILQLELMPIMKSHAKRVAVTFKEP